MSTSLHAFIGPSAVLNALAQRWVEALAVALPQGLALVPLTDALLDDIADLTASSPRIGHANVPPVPNGVALVVSEASDGGVLAWVQRDRDSVAAVVWEAGRVVLGPLAGEGALDETLRRVGAWARPGESVVDALGLRWSGTDALAARGTAPFAPRR